MKELGRESEKEDILNVYRSHKPDIQLYPGVKEMINKLRKENIKIGIITDGRSEGQRNKLKALNLITLIDDIIITDELGGIQFRKPCDIAFRIIATRWKLPFHQIVYIGDNPNKDLQAPRQLGMKSILLENNDGLYISSKNTKTTHNKKGLKFL